jgi:glutamine cyclotransferase
MLTWKGGTGFVYDIQTYKPLGTFRIPSTEGWGLTHDTASLIMSDGTNNIYYLNPETFQVKYTISVNDNGEPLGNINELEYVNGVIYANRWQTPYILKIDAKSGTVLGKIDLSTIDNEIAAKGSDTHEMNGIAYNQQNGTLFITGKKWPTVYELKLQ